MGNIMDIVDTSPNGEAGGLNRHDGAQPGVMMHDHLSRSPCTASNQRSKTQMREATGLNRDKFTRRPVIVSRHIAIDAKSST